MEDKLNFKSMVSLNAFSASFVVDEGTTKYMLKLPFLVNFIRYIEENVCLYSVIFLKVGHKSEMICFMLLIYILLLSLFVY